MSELAPEQVSFRLGRMWSHVTVDGYRHHTPIQHARRIEAMLGR